ERNYSLLRYWIWYWRIFYFMPYT
ncbi:XapX-like protein, partial [Salmonella enterica subsp. enterica serovar Enteritidis]